MSDEMSRLMNRFVRPIYDAIDSRQYKVAIKHCAHKKVAHLDIVLVLKAHCLERTGRDDEALAICRAVQRRKPTDETLLNTMNLVFKLTGCEHEMLPTFEHACAVGDPPNEELFASLFYAYVRRGDFLKQQQTALKMFKAFGGVKYMSWAALSMALQVAHGSAPARMLALAERMQLKTLRDLASTDGEALQLVVRILQLQDKHDDALRAFDEFATPRTETLITNKKTHGRSAEGEGAYEEDIELGPMLAIDRLVLEATLATRVCDFARAARVYEELLTQHSADDWTFLTEWVAARFALHDNGDDGDVARAAADAQAFLVELQAQPANERLRGPQLAGIHVAREVFVRLQRSAASSAAAAQDNDALNAAETALESRIVAYMDAFGTKTCCFSDLQQYFALFTQGDRNSVSNAARVRLVSHVVAMADAAIATDASSSEVDRPQALLQLHRRLLALKTLRFLGYYDDARASVAVLTTLVDSLVREYTASAWLNVGATGGQREVQNTDDLLLLAVHFLLDAYQRSCGETATRRALLLRAAALLELGLAHSAYNFQMKLLLARIYAFVGASDAMRTRHAELDIKHVQLDSLAFLVLDKLVQLCDFEAARKFVDSVQRMHRGTDSDTPEYIAKAYKTGVYSKVVDLTQFLHTRMRKSHALATSKSESVTLTLMAAMANSNSAAALHDVLVSQAFASRLDELDALLAHGDALSRNYHREVVVSWTVAPIAATGDTFARDDAPLVECDRSASQTTSLQWLVLRATVGKLLRSVAVSESTEVLDALAQQYGANVAQLALLPVADDTAATPQQLIWQWSVRAVEAAVALVNAASGDANGLTKASTAIVELQPLLASVAAVVPNVLVVARSSEATAGVAWSPYGLATLSLLLGECGLWTLCLLSTVLRVVAKKKSRKDDAFVANVSGLRALLKQLQELFVELEVHVGAFDFANDSDEQEDDVVSSSSTNSDATSSDGLAVAERHVAANVLASYKATQLRVLQLLRDRAAFAKAK